MTVSLSAVVLAAGEGTRMRSSLPKPLHEICGRPMVLHVLDALAELDVNDVVVVIGHGGNATAKAVTDGAAARLNVRFVEQPDRLGTGDAVAVGLTALDDDEDGNIVVLPSDTPLLTPKTLASLVAAHRSADIAATVLVADVDDPSGYGRVVRLKNGDISKVVEQADATEEEVALTEVNTSVYCFRRSVLAPTLRRLHPDNAQGEYYLTDAVAVLASAGYRVLAVKAQDPGETAGVNDRIQLAAAERSMQQRINDRWMRQGVTITDSLNTYIDATVQLGADAVILPGSILGGATKVGKAATIGPATRLVDTTVGDGAVVVRTEANRAIIGEGATVGPFAVLEPGAVVAPGSKGRPFFVTGAWDV